MVKISGVEKNGGFLVRQNGDHVTRFALVKEFEPGSVVCTDRFMSGKMDVPDLLVVSPAAVITDPFLQIFSRNGIYRDGDHTVIYGIEPADLLKRSPCHPQEIQ
jgi:hypothetical protein